MKERSRKSYLKNREKILDPANVRKGNLAKKYGITQEDYNRMLAEQDGCCKICRSSDPVGVKSFAVDHDHVTGKVRGLLCHRCNPGLGYFQDNPELLRKAIDYLLEAEEESLKSESRT